MAAYQATYQTDLAAPSRVISIPHVFAMGDNESHTFTALVYNSRDPECGLMDGSVSGVVVRPDGGTVPLTGEKGEDVVEVTLPDGSTAQATACTMTLIQGCFAFPGQITIVIRLIDGDQATAVLVARGTVTTSLTDTIVDPGDVVPDITQLLACIEDCQDAAAEARESCEVVEQVAANNLAAGMTYTNGKTIVASTGATRNSTYYRSSDYIDISGCTKIIYPRLVLPTSSALNYDGAAFYNSSKTFIADSGTPALLGAYSNWTATVLTVPDGAKYFRATWVPADSSFNDAGEFWIYDANALDGTMADTVIMLDEEGFATQQSIAPVDTQIAKATHTAGTLLVVDGVLYKAVDGIAVGDTITDHATRTTVAAQLAALEARIAALENN